MTLELWRPRPRLLSIALVAALGTTAGVFAACSSGTTAQESPSEPGAPPTSAPAPASGAATAAAAAAPRAQADDAFRRRFTATTPAEEIAAAVGPEMSKVRSVLVVATLKGTNHTVTAGKPTTEELDVEFRQQVVASPDHQNDAHMTQDEDRKRATRTTTIQVGKTSVTKTEPLGANGEVTKQEPFGPPTSGAQFVFPGTEGQEAQWKGATVTFETRAGAPVIKLASTSAAGPLQVTNTWFIDGATGLPLELTEVITVTTAAGQPLTQTTRWSDWNKSVPPIALPR